MPSPSPLVAVLEEADKLARSWKRLPLQHRLRLLEGLPEAEITAANESGGEGRRGYVDVLRDLVLTPMALCVEVCAIFRVEVAVIQYGPVDKKNQHIVAKKSRFILFFY